MPTHLACRRATERRLPFRTGRCLVRPTRSVGPIQPGRSFRL